MNITTLQKILRYTDRVLSEWKPFLEMRYKHFNILKTEITETEETINVDIYCIPERAVESIDLKIVL